MGGVRRIQPDSRMKEIESRNSDSPTVALVVFLRVRARPRSSKRSVSTPQNQAERWTSSEKPMAVHHTRRCAE
jgi:hypothetical protein